MPKWTDTEASGKDTGGDGMTTSKPKRPSKVTLAELAEAIDELRTLSPQLSPEHQLLLRDVARALDFPEP